jgi:hypothetical protein
MYEAQPTERNEQRVDMAAAMRTLCDDYEYEAWLDALCEQQDYDMWVYREQD